ncbi:MAG: alkaline phosphatase [Citrobacter freundii]|nr:MAG: alkaline phosphatase [Citrobacter freundii]
MERRSFLRNSSLIMTAGALFGPARSSANSFAGQKGKTVRNIIFMVSDGMSTGTLNMTDLLLQRKEGRRSTWLSLYDEKKVTRALMDTASASSLVTDSAAASSSWGGGKRVKNGSLNTNADGSFNIPILQKFKAAGKAVGCVTTVPITHATPAGFCICNDKRGDQEEIAMQYLPLRFDVMMGGGKQYFSAEKRKDKQDMLRQYRDKGYDTVTEKKQLLSVTGDKPLLGVFADDGLPYTIDQQQDETVKAIVPTLSEMTATAISLLNKHPNGFVLQVEAGKVDWAAHANDISALVYDQAAFDDAIREAINFASSREDTLVIITTDHGNANPGLFYGNDANRNFDMLRHFRHSNDWILNGIDRNFFPQQVIERVEYATGMALKKEEATTLLASYSSNETGIYNPRHLPFKYLADLQRTYTSVGWASMDHSADFVELALYGPGSQLLPPFVKNTDLHFLMLQAAGIPDTGVQAGSIA